MHAGKDADAYIWVVTEDYGYGRVVASYTFFVDQVRCLKLRKSCLVICGQLTQSMRAYQLFQRHFLHHIRPSI